jgi:hypothetical protein
MVLVGRLEQQEITRVMPLKVAVVVREAQVVLMLMESVLARQQFITIFPALAARMVAVREGRE